MSVLWTLKQCTFWIQVTKVRLRWSSRSRWHMPWTSLQFKHHCHQSRQFKVRGLTLTVSNNSCLRINSLPVLKHMKEDIRIWMSLLKIIHSCPSSRITIWLITKRWSLRIVCGSQHLSWEERSSLKQSLPSPTISLLSQVSLRALSSYSPIWFSHLISTTRAKLWTQISLKYRTLMHNTSFKNTKRTLLKSKYCLETLRWFRTLHRYPTSCRITRRL